ncbi:MAG: gamma-glutamyl-gamma-aminobutyrate hydrolase family protein [Microthrixaceae bacterium]
MQATTNSNSGVASAPIIAVTYSSLEFAGWDRRSPWQFTLRSVVAAGGVPLAIDCATEQPKIVDLVALADGLLVLGGGDVDPRRYGGDTEDPTVGGVNPMRDENEVAALAAARSRGCPTLAICRGFQLLNADLGGVLVADLPRDRPSFVDHRPGMGALMGVQHDVDVSEGSQLARWLGRSGAVGVNSEHHQGLAQAGDGLVITARSADGLVEAVETPDGRVVGVQWHPEMLWTADEAALDLLRGFVAECRSWRDEDEHGRPIHPRRRAPLP